MVVFSIIAFTWASIFDGEFVSLNLLCAIPGAIAIGVMFRAGNSDTKSKLKGEEKYAKDIQNWRHMKEKWVGLYYCYRHHLVFDPNTGEQCQPENLLAFLRGEQQ
jgi:hypothetical protein